MTTRKDSLPVIPLPRPSQQYDERDQIETRNALSRMLQEMATRTVLDGGLFSLANYSDSTRPDPGGVDPGTVIWNTDDDQMNVSDGTDWTLPDGTTT